MFDQKFFDRLGVKARVICDSVPSGIDFDGQDTRRAPARLVTLEVRDVPTLLIKQFNTHSSLSRSWQSGRAKPVRLVREQVATNPALPPIWTRNARGMQAAGPVYDQSKADYYALRIRDVVLDNVAEMEHEMGIAKQDANRFLEPFGRSHGVFTGTTTAWLNLFLLRCSDDAQPSMAGCTLLMLKAWRESMPIIRAHHLPYVDDEGEIEALSMKSYDDEERRANHHRLSMISAARCARVSYRLFDGTTNTDEDLRLANDLREGHEAAPFQHPASVWTGGVDAVYRDDTPVPAALRSAYAEPWVQFRKTFAGESLAGRTSMDEALADVFSLDLPSCL